MTRASAQKAARGRPVHGVEIQQPGTLHSKNRHFLEHRLCDGGCSPFTFWLVVMTSFQKATSNMIISRKKKTG